MLIILRESLTTGRYSFFRGVGGDIADKEDLREAITDEDNESQYYPLLRTRPDTLRPSISTTQTPS